MYIMYNEISLENYNFKFTNTKQKGVILWILVKKLNDSESKMV